jgi:hypothetical protein
LFQFLKRPLQEPSISRLPDREHNKIGETSLEKDRALVALMVGALLFAGALYVAPALADSILGNPDPEGGASLPPCEFGEYEDCPYEEMHGGDETDDCPHEDHGADGEHDHSGSGCGMMDGDHSEGHGPGMHGGDMGGHMGGSGGMSGRGMGFMWGSS